MTIAKPLVGIVVAGLALTLGSAPAHAVDFADADDFWSSASRAAVATMYVPSDKGLRHAGLGPWGEPPDGQGELTMICSGQWNVSATFDAEDSDASATIYQATPGCTDDFGVGDGKGTWSFRAHGRPFTIRYQDCRGTSEGDPTPAVSDCPADKAIYSAYGTLPASAGKKRTYLHLDTLGLTRAQIKVLVRSLHVVD